MYLAAKTTNYPIPMSHFRDRFAKLNPQDILDNEFLVAQSLAFEFWVRGPDKALRGWALDLQVCAVVLSLVNHIPYFDSLTRGERIVNGSRNQVRTSRKYRTASPNHSSSSRTLA